VIRVERFQKSAGSLTVAASDDTSAALAPYPYLIGADNDQLVWHVSKSQFVWTKLR